MKCKNSKILISAAADGELSVRERNALEKHLSRCPVCAREQAEIANIRDVMAVWADETPSAWLAENFAYRLQDEMARGCAPARRPRRVLGTALAGFATALLAFGIIFHSQFMPEQKLVPQPPAVIHQPLTANPAPGAGHTRVAAVPEKPTVAPPTIVNRVPSRKPMVHRIVRTPGRSGSRATAMASRGGLTHDAEVKRMVLRNIILASHAQGDAETTVADQLTRANLTMSESVEEVRGALTKAVDNLARTNRDGGTL